MVPLTVTSRERGRTWHAREQRRARGLFVWPRDGSLPAAWYGSGWQAGGLQAPAEAGMPSLNGPEPD